MRFLSSLSIALLSAASLLASLPALAQVPANDRCSAAQLIPAGGFGVANTANANDDIIGVTGCQTGTAAHPDVWFTFTASGSSSTTVMVTPDASSATTPYEILVFDGTCGALMDVGTKCSAGGTDSVRVAVSSGTTYYVAIASPSATQTGIFIVQAISRSATFVPAQDCMNANVLPTGLPIQQGPLNLGAGTDPNEVDPMNSCWGGGGERQPKWYKFIAGSDGKLTFNINPTDPNTDYDWAVWDITSDPAGCTTKGNAIACNWTGARGATGLSLCEDLEPGFQGGDQFDNKTTMQTGANAPIDLQAGRIYALLVDNFSTNSSGFRLTFGGACPPLPGQPNALANIGLEAEFDYTQIGCREYEFRKRNPVAVGAAANLTYRWTFSNGAGAGADSSSTINPTYTFPASTDTTFDVTLQIILPTLVDPLTNRALQWSSARTVTIVPPQPAITRSVTTELCPGDSVTLTARGGTSFRWRGPGVPAGFTGSRLTVGPDTTASYRLIAMRNMCSDSTDVEVRVAEPQVSAGTILIPAGVPPHTTGFTTTTPGAQTYRWNFGDTSADSVSTQADPMHTYSAVGTYRVTLSVTYGPGCEAARVFVGNVVVDVINPGNIITPNNDGKNDYFEARLTGAAQRLEVFNRWGRKVYERDNYQKEWNGGDLPAGTYYYHLTGADGKSWKGWVEIVR